MASPTELHISVQNARRDLQNAIDTDSLELASSALASFRTALQIAVDEARFMQVSAMVSEMWRAFKLSELVETFRTGKVSEALFRACIQAFPPDESFISRLEKTRIDIDLMLTEALFYHEHLQLKRSLALATDLAERASHQALAMVLKHFFAHCNAEVLRDNAVDLLTLFNSYGRDFPAGKKIPAHLLDLIIEHQASFLAIFNTPDRQFGDRGIINLKVLKQLHARGENELVKTMAPKLMFTDTSPWSLLDLEAMGFSPSMTDLRNKLFASTTWNETFLCSALYALHSPTLDLHQYGEVITLNRLTCDKWVTALQHTYAQVPAGQRSELIEEKLRATLIALASMSPMAAGFPDALLNIQGLSRDEVMAIPALAEIFLCADLGL